MRRIRKLLLAMGITLAMLLPLAGVASADPGDGGGFAGAAISGPTITAGPNTFAVPPVGGLQPGATTTAADPGDGGGF